MKTHQIFTVIIAIACIFMLTSYKNKPVKQTDETLNNHKIVREYFDGKTFYILDEPTTGLHFQDIQHLLDVLNKLSDRGNTVLVIEHNMDVIKVADHIIDLGPEGGDGGGQILFEGTPEGLVTCKESYTGQFLKTEL